VSEASFERFRRMMDLMQFESLPLFSKPHFQWNLTTDYVGRRFVYRPDTESTMDDARRMIERFRLGEGAIVLAETQTAGRGRAGRTWVSPPDVNLYFTLVLQPEADEARCLAYVAPLAIAHAVEDVAAANGVTLRADLKWPNDVQIEGRKVAGVLIETTQNAAGRLFAFVGVGLNVNLDVAAYPEISDIAVSLRDACGFTIHREEVLAAFCNHFEALYERARKGDNAPFMEWRSRLVNLGRPVIANGAIARIEGVAVDVDADGGLVIELADGSRTIVEAGDVTLSSTPRS
jgi:BirA family biotin operon repressor/biotin-[acetyl-CoA-carboxylase] ligase